MTIKNTGSKIVSIGTTVLMPDQSMTVSKAVAETPAIKALVKKEFLAVIDDEKPAKKPAAKADDAAAKKAAEEAKKAADEAAKKAADEAAKNAAQSK